MPALATVPHPAHQAPGLVVMLDLAGKSVAALECRVTALEDELATERQLRATLERLLAEARAVADTGDVRASRHAARETCDHATDPARPRPS